MGHTCTYLLFSILVLYEEEKKTHFEKSQLQGCTLHEHFKEDNCRMRITGKLLTKVFVYVLKTASYS